MNDYLKEAKAWLAEADVRDSATTLHAIAAAAIAQAEAQERSAVAMARIAALFDSVIEKVGGSPSISTYDAYQTWKENL